MIVRNTAINVSVRECHAYRGGLSSIPGQSKWILWWEKWHWDSLILRVLRDFLSGISPPTFPIYTHGSFIYRRRHINLRNVAPFNERVTRIHVNTVTHRKWKCLDILLNTDGRGKESHIGFDFTLGCLNLTEKNEACRLQKGLEEKKENRK
jgi:hypothetical protein